MKKIKFITVLLSIILMFSISTPVAFAASYSVESLPIHGFVPLNFEYYDNIEISAYYPAEDARWPNNFKSIPLNQLVGDIVACPNGSDLLGKYIMIITDEGPIFRQVWDTGCKSNRLDLLVNDNSEMNDWGLRHYDVYVLK